MTTTPASALSLSLFRSIITENEEDVLQARLKGVKLSAHEYNQALQWAVVKGSSSMVKNIFDMSPTDETNVLEEETISLGLRSPDLDVVKMFLGKTKMGDLPHKTQRVILFDRSPSPPPPHLELLLDHASLPIHELLYWFQKRSSSMLWSLSQPTVLASAQKIFKNLPQVPESSLIKSCIQKRPFDRQWGCLLWEECVARSTQQELLVSLFTQALTVVVEKQEAKKNQKTLSEFIGDNMESIKPYLTKDQTRKLVKWNQSEKESKWLPVFLKHMMADSLPQKSNQSRTKKM